MRLLPLIKVLSEFGDVFSKFRTESKVHNAIYINLIVPIYKQNTYLVIEFLGRTVCPIFRFKYFPEVPKMPFPQYRLFMRCARPKTGTRRSWLAPTIEGEQPTCRVGEPSGRFNPFRPVDRGYDRNEYERILGGDRYNEKRSRSNG